jgi:hypothetical protein
VLASSSTVSAAIVVFIVASPTAAGRPGKSLHRRHGVA